MTADSEDHSRVTVPEAHAASHEAGGSDPINHSALVPHNHASRHEAGGPDVINVSGLVGKSFFVSRGNVSAWDWSTGDFTKDSGWHDLDLSSIVPAGAFLVELKVSFVNTAASQLFRFKKKGFADAFNSAGRFSQVANINFECNLSVECDASRFVQYNLASGTWTDFNLAVKGWWI